MVIKINCHSSIKMKGDNTIYIDPFKIEKEKNDADIIFITHNHYDHYSEEDIDKLVALYKKETEELNQDTLKRKKHIEKMLKEMKN